VLQPDKGPPELKDEAISIKGNIKNHLGAIYDRIEGTKGLEGDGTGE